MSKEYNHCLLESLPKFKYYTVPKALFIDEELNSLSNDAKLLYGLMLSRINLSIKNKWFDKENHAYIYFSVEKVCKLLNCSNGKCCKLFQELENLKLIKRKKQGQGKPAIIYVMNFNSKNQDIKYDYFSEKEKKEFKFYRIPKQLFNDEFKNLSNTVKLLYGLILDELSLSLKKKRLYKEENILINFTIKELSRLLKCCEKTCSNLLSILKEIGLINFKLQGQGKPAIIYINKSVQEHIAKIKDCIPKKIFICKLNLFKGKKFKAKGWKKSNLRQEKIESLDKKKLEVLTGKKQKSKQEKIESFDKKKLERKRTYTGFINTDLKQQQEREQSNVVVKLKELLSFIQEPLTEKELQSIFNIANNNIKLIKEKYDIMKTQSVRNVVGFLISAIKNDFQPPKSYTKSYTKVNRFVNYDQREWDFEKLEKMQIELIDKELQESKREAQNNIDKKIYNQTIDEIKSKVNYEKLINEFSNYKDKIDTLINVLAESISSREDYIFYDCRTIIKSKTSKTLKGLNYNHMKNIILHSFNKSIPNILIDLADFCTAVNY